MDKKRIIRHRIVLGLLLFIGAALFMWGQTFLADTVEDMPVLLPLVGYCEPFAEYENGDTDINVPVFPLVGLEDIIFTPPAERPVQPAGMVLSDEYVQRLMSFDYLVSNIFLVDRYTALFPSDIDTDAFLRADLRIDTSVPGPQVLIFHAHSQERFVGSNPLDPMSGVMGLGRELAEILANKYGIDRKMSI